MSFGKILKSLREDKDLKQDDVAKIIKVDRSTVGKWENGTSNPDYEKLIQLASLFSVSVDYLLGVTKIRNTHDTIQDALTEDEELLEFWNDLKEREELKLLFKQTKELDKATIQQVIRIIKAIEDEESQ